MDPAVNNLMLSIAQQEVTDANAELAAATTAVNNKTAELNTAIAQRTAAVNSLNSLIRNGQASSQIDGLLNTLLAAAGTWGSTSYASAAADSKVTQATQLRDRWATEVSKYNAMLADIPGTISRLNSEIAALDLLIATNPPNKTDLQNERDGKDAERKLAGDVAGLTAVRDKAVAELAIAQTALDNAVAAQTAASAAYSTAQTSYQSAISNFVNGTARYNIYNSSGAVVAYGCTTACQAGDVNINSVGQLGSALVDLFGLGAMTSPSTDAKYLKPVKLQKELDALNQRLAAAQDRKATADARLLEAQNRINNPPPCNATGSAVVPMTPEQAESILADVDRKGGTR
jgi:chromosome segregation ATPase